MEEVVYEERRAEAKFKERQGRTRRGGKLRDILRKY